MANKQKETCTCAPRSQSLEFHAHQTDTVLKTCASNPIVLLSGPLSVIKEEN